jgi:hypothetical protein
VARKWWVWLAGAALVVVALVLIGVHGHNQYLYKECVAIQHGLPPSEPFTGSALAHLPPGRHLVSLGGTGFAYASVGQDSATLVRCTKPGWP